MHRATFRERDNWQNRLEEAGFDWHTPGGVPYWEETAAWVFSLKEIEQDIEAPTAELESLCLEWVGRAVKDENILQKLAIPESHWDWIAQSWQRGERNLYGRFDLAYDGRGPAKLLEYNADTPTSLLEASVIQWMWLEDHLAASTLPKGTDQFNSLHEKLIAAFHGLRGGQSYHLHLACGEDSAEDAGTVAYLADCAAQAGLSTQLMTMPDIGLSSAGQFVDAENRLIEVLFKLYPWEWMFADSFAASLHQSSTLFIEPPWKSLLSNKGILPLLWEMAPHHPHLLPAYFSDDPRASFDKEYVEKPLYSREGANVRLKTQSGLTRHVTSGPYDTSRTVRQELAPLARSSGRHMVIGSWVIASEPAGIGLREDESLITRDTARFVPHIISA